MIKRYLGPILVVAAGLALAVLIFATGPRPDRQPGAPALAAVRTLPAAAGPVRMLVTTHGTVVPKTESNLVAEVSGRVDLLRMTGETVYVKGDISAGEEICVSALDSAMEGQQVAPTAANSP